MGKKKAEVMKAEREQFVAGARERGVSARDAARVFDLMEHFAGYGFNRSHSAAYALVAFRTAYLKAHYPVHFMAALLTAEKDNTDKLSQYILDCRPMGISVLPPDINSSAFDFSVEGPAIRFGLSAVKNVGEGAVESILEARGRVGSFTSLHQFCREVEPQKVAKRAAESLIKAGAFDGIGLVRPRLMKALDHVMDSARRFQEQRASGQASLFGGSSEEGAVPEPAESLPEAEPWTDLQLLAFEKETLGFYVTGHPLAAYSEILAEFGARPTSHLDSIPPDGDCTIGGIITGLRPRKTRKGDWMAVFTLEDLEGAVETLLFPEAYKSYGATLSNELPVLLKGKVESEEGRVRLIASSVVPLADARRQKAEAMLIRVSADALDAPRVEQLRAVLAGARGDCPVFLEIRAPRQFALTVRAEAGLKVGPTPELTAAVERLCGQGAVRFRVRSL
jgi:DNA polymerase-3 subunit alpha